MAGTRRTSTAKTQRAAQPAPAPEPEAADPAASIEVPVLVDAQAQAWALPATRALAVAGSPGNAFAVFVTDRANLSL